MTQEDKSGESAIDQARVELIRSSASDTRELVRALATYLFLECGVHPTATTVRSLARQGSMTTITSELSSWWQNLRDRMRPTLAAPDVPDAMRNKLAELGAEIWITASEEARVVFEAERMRLEGLAESADRRAEDAVNETHAVRLELAVAAEDKLQLHQRLEKREDELAEAQKSASMLRNEVERRTQENRETQERLATAQSEFTKELDKQRAAIGKIEQRAADDLRRQHQEVDRARQESLRKSEELARVKESAERSAATAQAALSQATKAHIALEQRLAQLSSERTISEAALQGSIKGLENQLSMTGEMLAATKLSLLASEARETSMSDELRAMRATLDRVLAERPAMVAPAGSEPATPNPAAMPKDPQA